MRYSRKEIVRKFRNAFIVLTCLFLAVIIGSGYKIYKNGGEFWSQLKTELFIDPGLAIPFAATFLVAAYLVWRDRSLNKSK